MVILSLLLVSLFYGMKEILKEMIKMFREWLVVTIIIKKNVFKTALMWLFPSKVILRSYENNSKTGSIVLR